MLLPLISARAAAIAAMFAASILIAFMMSLQFFLGPLRCAAVWVKYTPIKLSYQAFLIIF